MGRRGKGCTVDTHAKSQAKGRKRVGVAALAVLLTLGGASAARAQLIDRLPPLPQVPELLDVHEIQTILGMLNSVAECVPQAFDCRSGFDCCEPCAGRANGTYCGDEVFPFGDTDTRYACQGGQLVGVTACSQFCEDGRCVDPGGGFSKPL